MTRQEMRKEIIKIAENNSYCIGKGIYASKIGYKYVRCYGNGWIQDYTVEYAYKKMLEWIEWSKNQ